MSEEIAVSVNNVFKVFGKKPAEAVKRIKAGQSRTDVAALGTAAVVDASFDVKAGEIFVVMGLSGSGKSTLIRMLNGLVPASAGTVVIGGTDISSLSGKALRQVRQKKISMVFQHFALMPHRTIIENAAYGLEVQGVARKERLASAAKVLSLVGLAGWEDKYPAQLSGGMQQRVGLARALCAETDILLMDEAFSALDPLIRREMQEQLLGLQSDLGKTIIFITHDLNEAMFLGDRIAVMRDGEIVQVGTPDDILTQPANDYVAHFVQDVDRTRVLTAGSVMEPARAVVNLTGGPRNALRAMRDLQTSAAFVVDRRRKFHGIVRDRDVMTLVENRDPELSSVVRNRTDFVSPETALADLFGLAVESPIPLAVVDDDGKLVGAIPRVTLLAALGNVPSTTTGLPIVEATPAPIPEQIVTDTLESTAAEPAAHVGGGN
ncbi:MULTISPECIES: glycine betaine/L-proline ABC transporter ATP-binding protein [Arthrobacter]|uniref:Glycine betaine/L-proline ABC transporter ATP-binding protein n=1 Tax=Arthrobacter oryzae TaxID=409290 RepID=A0A3N0C5M3_9MICC|nr:MULTISPECIES: glycine betaine/L-proline ABC transporter ATP-binding protein [Arthrobacter]QYF90196.1 glycine betaine/L-proline ABC transporter ATP-binding protein [Arthrobacter sp. PAMC25284]RNL58330.1 glycine betaine/L-proline ABC transporter ATP-binding protein [Arthrobacter oryzae]